MTTKQIIEKALEIIGNRFVVTTIYFQQTHRNLDKLQQADLSITVFYGTTNFTLHSYNATNSHGLEELFLDLRKKMLQFDVLDASSSSDITFQL